MMMGLLKELMRMSREELEELLNRNLEKVKQNHDIAIKMGSLGVPLSYLNRYIEANKKIESYEEVQ